MKLFCPLSLHSNQVNTNGIISFIKNVSQYTPDVFPLDDDRRIIAPYWADADTSTQRGVDGKVWYRQTNDTTLLTNLTDQIRSVFRVEFRFRPFVATFAFVATWENVTFYTISGGAAVKVKTPGKDLPVVANCRGIHFESL